MTGTARPGTESDRVTEGLSNATGVLPSQRLRDAVSHGWMVAGAWRIPAESVQPASIDLRLGEFAWALRCSFLPDSSSSVEEKTEGLAFEKIDLRDGATLLEAAETVQRPDFDVGTHLVGLVESGAITAIINGEPT